MHCSTWSHYLGFTHQLHKARERPTEDGLHVGLSYDQPIIYSSAFKPFQHNKAQKRTYLDTATPETWFYYLFIDSTSLNTTSRFENLIIYHHLFLKSFVIVFHAGGASSMWASCCGLLNEVMGTGAVRGQQPGFGAGAGPFRFAPTAGYSTYPPTNSTNTSLVCQSCRQAFSVFRRRVGRPAHLPLPYNLICFAH